LTAIRTASGVAVCRFVQRTVDSVFRLQIADGGQLEALDCEIRQHRPFF